ncbi:phosphonate ABC transporter ATP-binding protein [Magnetovibrio sp. PR-2]|uniref:phosphonate ABC transporter ATP-binding protein n=1 Tax=Magnetovibrio sp. PR-2 TaxID=3120356 RepID=UPI002FCDE361
MAQSIHVTGLNKTFKKDKALDNIDFSAEAGEMVALIGASGSGKSTLIRHIAGLMPADKGTGRVEVLGNVIQEKGKIARNVRHHRQHISVIFQQFNLVSRMSVLTNVLLGKLGSISTWRGSLALFTKEEKLDAMRALEQVGMAKYATQRASTLSGGQQQRVAIARALLQKSDIILADEPIASLDPESSRKVMEALAHIHREFGKTVVVSLHQVDYALKYCPRTLALKDGKTHYDGLSRDLSVNFLQNLYGSDSLDMHIPVPLDVVDETSATPQPNMIQGPASVFGLESETALGTA